MRTTESGEGTCMHTAHIHMQRASLPSESGLYVCGAVATLCFVNSLQNLSLCAINITYSFKQILESGRLKHAALCSSNVGLVYSFVFLCTF